MGATPILLALFFLAAIWRGDRGLTISALAVATAALVGVLIGANTGFVKDVGGLVAYLVLLMGYFGLALRSR